MEHKAWLWRRKSSEKTIATNGKPDLLFPANEQENEKALELERSIEDLKEQLSSALIDSNAKDNLLAKQVKEAEEAIAGWEKAKTEAESLKKELADALLQKAADEERLVNKDAALKECMQKLCVVKEENQHARNDAATRISRVQEEALVLEKRLVETNNNLAKLGIENSNLTRILGVKEKLIKDLTESKSQSEANFTTLVARLDSSDKDNASLKYEICMLHKELEIGNQHRVFHLKSADASHNQYLESMKKISKLESDCQRLRVMVQKRLPGPAAIAKMKSEVQILDNSFVDRMRKKPMLAPDAMMSRDVMSGSDYDLFSKRVSSLIEILHAVEDENKILKEALVKKNNELQSSRIMFARRASKLSQAEKQLEEFSKERVSLELARSTHFWNDLPLALISEEGRNDDAICCSESWASALISELEHFKIGKATTPSTTTVGISELSLMDDFIEMEKLAIVCADKQSESSNINSGERITSLVPKGIDSKVISSESAANEMVPVSHSDFSNSLGGAHAASILQNETNKQPFWSDLEKPLCKMIELIEGIIQRSFTNNIGPQIFAGKAESTAPQNKSISPNGHVGHVFLGEIPEACDVLQHFIIVCNDLLHGKADFKKFTYELVATLEWINNHCFSVQDLSTMEEKIKMLFSGNVSHGNNEFKDGIYSLSTETNKVKEPDELNSRMAGSLSLSTLLDGQSTSKNEDSESKVKDENERLRSQIRDIESRKKDLEEKNESLSTQLKESDERISNLHAELVTLKYSNTLIEDQIENQKFITEDLGTRLIVANAELKEARQKFSSLEVELEDKSNSCEELEATCLELQLQLESVTTEETPTYDKVQEEKQLRTDWEISAASEKLAECQATILSLGKQLKALAAPKDASLFDKVMSSPSTNRINGRPHLLDQMLAEDEATSEHLKSPKTKEIICTEIKQPPSSTACENNPIAGLLYGRMLHGNKLNQPSPVKSSDAGRLVLVQRRQKGGASFLKKLLSRRKKESSKKKASPVGS